MGCYWNGVSAGIDCPCCGDRWDYYFDVVDLEKINEKGREVRRYDDDAAADWHETYDKYEKLENPSWKKTMLPMERKYSGRIKFRTIEEYVQFYTNEYGFRNRLISDPISRMYYHDGTVKEFFKER